MDSHHFTHNGSRVNPLESVSVAHFPSLFFDGIELRDYSISRITP